MQELPIPPHFNHENVKKVWMVPYDMRADEARKWSREYSIKPASEDNKKICLIGIDIQNTFCIPGFELYVGGRSGTGAVEDNKRLCEFIYRNLHLITKITLTLDTHQPIQIFHSLFLVNEEGEHPDPFTLITRKDIIAGKWKFNRAVANTLGIKGEYGEKHLSHYVAELQKREKYDLMVWPYHAMLGGIGHALVSSVEETVFFHSVARYSQPDFEIKGQNPFLEHYSAIGPEILTDHTGAEIARKNSRFFDIVKNFDAVYIAGQAKSHCVAWSVDDLLDELLWTDKTLAEKVYLLEDCTSSVVIPGVVDYTEVADSAFKRFEDAGINIIRSTDPLPI